jgi:putative peptidoglycan lipid II flippase
LPRYALNTQDEGVRRILKLMGPAIFGVSVAQISIVLNNVFASFMPTGSVSWLYYADRLMEFPTGVLGVALGTILLPSLSKAHVDKSAAEFSQLLDWGLRLTFMLAIPAAVAMAVLSKPLVASLFYYGRFTAIDVAETERALIAYSLSLLGLIMVKVLAPGFYARQNVKTPVKIAIFTLVMTQVFNVLFLYFTPLRHAGLALAVGLGACLNATLLWVNLQRSGAFVPNKGWGLFLAKLLLAVTIMAVALHLVATASGDWLSMPTLDRLLHLAGVVVMGMLIYFATLGLLGFHPRDFTKRVGK